MAVEPEHLEDFLGLQDFGFRFRQFVFRLLQRQARRRLMLEQVLRHREGLLRELLVFVAGHVIRDGRGHLTAVQHEKHVVFADVVPDVHGQLLHLARHRRKNARHPIGVEFHVPRRLDGVSRRVAGELFDAHLLELGRI